MFGGGALKLTGGRVTLSAPSGRGCEVGGGPRNWGGC